jgi:CII-binding regulator of phage lambda lysogenization HflD
MVKTFQNTPVYMLVVLTRVFENRVLRTVFSPKRDEVRGEWRKLNGEELHLLYSSQNIIKQIKSSRIR